MTTDLRAAAKLVLAAFVATVLLGLLLWVAFDVEVQTIDAAELSSRRDDARAFFAGDYVFIVVYAILTPLALWRFGRGLQGTARTVALVAAVLFVVAGVVDAIENALLLSAAGSGSQSTVDTAHGLAVPKVLLFVAATLPALVTDWRALQVLRGRA